MLLYLPDEWLRAKYGTHTLLIARHPANAKAALAYVGFCVLSPVCSQTLLLAWLDFCTMTHCVLTSFFRAALAYLHF